MNTIRKSVVITSDYTPSITTLYDVGKIFVNTDNDVTVTLPTPDNDLDVYIKNLGNGTTTVNKTNGVPTATRANRKIDSQDNIYINSNTCYLISYIKELDRFEII